MIELINTLTPIFGFIITIFAVVTLLSTNGRKAVKNLFRKNTKALEETNCQQTEDIAAIQKSLELLQFQLDAVQESAKQECRNEIKNIYYKYRFEKRIPFYERKTADVVYQLYSVRFNGNSYASLMYEQICKWEVDVDNDTDCAGFDE